MSAESSPPALEVLIVDDDDVDRLAIRRALTASTVRADVHEATGADEALELLRTGRFACAILDLRMPGRDGEWLLRAARAEGLATPLVMLTGHGDENTAVELMKAGASDYLSKAELSSDRLGRSLRHVLRVHAAEERARESLQALRSSEERLRVALDVASLGTFEHDCVTGEVSCDARCRELFGIPAEGELDVPFMIAAIEEEDRAAMRSLFEAACDPTSGGLYEVEYRVRPGCAGAERWLRTTARVSFEGGRATRMVGTVKDVTARKSYQEDLVKQAAFEQELMGIVSHDLRNPIAAMMLSASALLFKAQGDPVLERGLARIVTSGERATRMVRDLLDFTRARVGGGIPIKREPTDLHAIARGTLDEVHAGFPDRTLELREDGEADGEWDADRLAQVIANLVGNALAYSPSDSVVTVRSRGLPGEVELEVHNEGDPIAPDRLPFLFEPFRRGDEKSSERSIGLGLYIVRQIVAAHGGSAEVESGPETGTTFRILLPRRA